MRLAFEGARKTRAGDSIAHLTTAELRRVLPALSGRPMNSVHTSRHAVSVHTGSHEWRCLATGIHAWRSALSQAPLRCLAPERLAERLQRGHVTTSKVNGNLAVRPPLKSWGGTPGGSDIVQGLDVLISRPSLSMGGAAAVSLSAPALPTGSRIVAGHGRAAPALGVSCSPWAGAVPPTAPAYEGLTRGGIANCPRRSVEAARHNWQAVEAALQWPVLAIAASLERRWPTGRRARWIAGRLDR